MKWFNRIGLTVRIVSHLSLLLIITLIIGATAIWYAVSFQKTIHTLIARDMETLQAARGIQNALINQKGFVTYYFLDGDTKWLQELAFYRQSFQNWLQKAYETDRLPSHRELLDKIRTKYGKYIEEKDRVIDMYRSGARQEGEQMHWEVRGQFFELNELTQRYKDLSEQEIETIREMSREKAARVSSMVVVGLIVSVVLGVFLAFLLIVQVIDPIRRLAEMAPNADEPDVPANEVTVLSKRVRGLMSDIDRTRDELQQSKELLLHSEKMALVGKLATEVAHSIRNPMTSINMRLFSLQRNLAMSSNQKEDFEVVTEEMRRLDNIVRNFLEFSRPHKLRKQPLDIADIVEMAIDLLEYRLQLHAVELVHDRPASLPAIEADPELMKEVFVNLIVNACEAIGTGGRIWITEEAAVVGPMGRAVRVRVRDNGPGIPEEARERVFEPFHTTKSDGTGLGLFIVTRIVMEHGGRLDLESAAGKGATFVITLPVEESLIE